MSSRAHLAYARQRARKRFAGKVCAECGELDELALEEFDGRVLCRSHRLTAQGCAPTEDDHPFGRRNARTTRRIDASDHARLTVLQSYWPKGTQQNPGASRMLAIAAGLRRLANLLVLLREHIDGLLHEVERMARWLERAQRYIARELGANWEDNIPIDEGE